MDNYIVLKV